MGLTLNYELRLPAETPRTEVASLLGRLRHFAATLELEDVSPVADTSIDRALADQDAGLAHATIEGGYWESRSTEALLAEVTRMNRLMARFAGALSDAIGDEHLREGLDLRASLVRAARDGTLGLESKAST